MGKRERNLSFPFAGEMLLLVFKDPVHLSSASGENMDCFKHVSVERDGLPHPPWTKEAAFPNETVICGPYQRGN